MRTTETDRDKGMSWLFLILLILTMATAGYVISDCTGWADYSIYLMEE